MRAYCVDVWREFSINEKRTARHDEATRCVCRESCTCCHKAYEQRRRGGKGQRQGSHSNCAFNCQRCALGVQKKLTHSSGDKELANWTSSGGGNNKKGGLETKRKEREREESKEKAATTKGSKSGSQKC